MEWIKAHKLLIGAIFSGIAAALLAVGEQEAAAAVGMIGTFLAGAGGVKSDQYYKDRE